MSLAYIGPVTVDFHGDPKFSWTAQPTARGMRAGSISGLFTWVVAKQLSELVDNFDRRVPVGDQVGVLEPILFTDELLKEFCGWYLLTGCTIPAAQSDSLNDIVPVQLSGVLVGNREIVVTRSARARTVDYGSAPRAVVANPFAGELLVAASGHRFEREYDASSPHVTARLTPTDGPREMVEWSSVASSAGPLVLPAPHLEDYLGHRGGDVRAFDRYEGREVFGPSHRFGAATDIILTNGLVRLWVGNEGLPPFLNVSVFRSGTWRQVGTFFLGLDGSPEILAGVPRIAALSPDSATITLPVTNQGDVAVTLMRGTRGWQVNHGAASPAASGPRYVGFAGAPPVRALNGAAVASAVFGNGVRLSGTDAVLQQRWPALRPSSSWALALHWKPDATSGTQADSGIAAITDATGAEVETIRYFASDHTIRWTSGATVLSTAPLSFGAGADVFISLDFSAAGRSLTTTVNKAAVTHVADAHGTPSAAAFVALSIGQAGATFTTGGFGDGGFGDGPFGGLTVTGGALAGGLIDNVMILDALTDAEAAALGTATTALAGVPVPEGRLEWYAPYDAAMGTGNGSPITNGLVYETTVDGGSTQAADGNGLTRALVVLRRGSTKGVGLALSRTTTTFNVAALLALASDQDDPVSQLGQYAVATEQEVRIR